MKAPSLDRLIASIPPPQHPSGVSGSWDTVERELGLILPSDYKRFISTYGTGGFFPFELFVWNLLEERIDAGFILSQNEFAHDAEDDSLTMPELERRTPLFPFGADGVGSEFFWARSGSPDKWYVVIVKGGLKFHRLPDLGLTDFLVALLVDHEPKLTALWGSSGPS